MKWNESTGNVAWVTPNWGVNEILVAAFTTPNTTANEAGNIDLTEYGGMPAYKLGALSKTPCDFESGLGKNEGLSAPIYFSVGPNANGWTVLEPNTTYYYNVVNRNANGTESCVPPTGDGAANCKVRVQLIKPKSLGSLPAGTPNYSTSSCGGGGGGGAQSWNGTCPGYSATYQIKQPWRGDGANSQTHLNSLENGAALVVSFTTPATLRPRTGNITSYESTGAAACKTAVLSQTPCDFAGPGLGRTSASTAPVYFSGGGNALGLPVLQPNTTYYYNVLHRCSGPYGVADTCVGVCDVQVELSPP